MSEGPAPHRHRRDDHREGEQRPENDGLLGVVLLFLFYVVCMSASAFLYWHGTGKLPWA